MAGEQAMTTQQIYAAWLSYLHGLSIDAIAHRLGVSRRHVHWAIDEAKRRSRIDG
jgi:DNA-binding transcriptional regulator LsrR (DeoR family)